MRVHVRNEENKLREEKRGRRKEGEEEEATSFPVLPELYVHN